MTLPDNIQNVCSYILPDNITKIFNKFHLSINEWNKHEWISVKIKDIINQFAVSKKVNIHCNQ